MDRKLNTRIQYLPVAGFSAVMGLAGASLAWAQMEQTMRWARDPSSLLMTLTTAAFITMTVLYSCKLARFPQAVKAEFGHPMKLSFFPTFTISLVLLSIAAWPSAPALSAGLWYAGAGLHLILTLMVVAQWMHRPHFNIEHVSPAWFIPVVGNILIPIVGIHHANVEVSWFFFSVGLVFWVVLVTINFYRFLFHAPLPEQMMPTFFILIAPPAVGVIAYHALTGSIDGFTRVLYYISAFLMLMLLTQFHNFQHLRFSLSWWAYSFPTAAFTLASLVMYQATGVVIFQVFALTTLLGLSLLILLLLGLTLREVIDHKVCVPQN